MRERTLSARTVLLVAAVSTLTCAGPACGLAPGGSDDGKGSSGSTETSATTSAGGNGSGGVTGTIDPTPCDSSEDCEDGYCVSAYDAAVDPPTGPAVCVSACVEAGTLDRACTDDAACCGELVCDPQALCVEPGSGATDTGDTGGTDTTGTTGN